MNPTNIRDPDIPVTLGAFRALQDEVRRLDAALLAGGPLEKLFAEALAWGMAYGPVFAPPLWDTMRDSMAKQFAARAEQETQHA